MNTHRYQAHGRVTNYELTGLRRDRVWRNSRWDHVWRSVSRSFHPTTLEEWREWVARNDA